MKHCIYCLESDGQINYIGASRNGLRGSFNTRRRIGGTPRILRYVDDPGELRGWLSLEMSLALKQGIKLRNSKASQALARRLWMTCPKKRGRPIVNRTAYQREYDDLPEPFSFGA